MTDDTSTSTEPETPPATLGGNLPAPEGEGEGQEPKVYDEAYVRKLRDEAAGHRVRSQDRDAIAQRLAVELVRATGRLADPTDLKFDPKFLTEDSSIGAAIDDLLARKPHLAASRRPSGDVGQGRRSEPAPFSLLGALRGEG